MSTIFGFILLLGTLYAVWDVIRTIQGWLRGDWFKTFAQVHEEMSQKSGGEQFKVCLTAPFVLFREFGYSLFFVPILCIYGLMNDNKTIAATVLLMSLVLGVSGIYLMQRSLRLTSAYGKYLDEMKKLNIDPGKPVIINAQNLIETTKRQVLAGEEKIMPGGPVVMVLYLVMGFLCDVYVAYLFGVVVLGFHFLS